MSLDKILERWEPVIGLECHVQLQTVSKAFTGASAAFGGSPNSHTDPYTLALPGTLPVLSRATIDAAIKIGLATGCRLRTVSRFARKHYFYPDLPKGYQISQYDEPLCEGGAIHFLLEQPDGSRERRSVRLTRIHVEEDAGKNTHVAGAPVSLVDLNRAGVPLVEIVAEPDIRSAAEAAAYLRAIRQLVRWIGISDGNMDEGSLRCDANVSVRPRGTVPFGTRTELKNINSFKFVEQAIEYEIARQVDLIERGQRVVQETRLWSPGEGVSKSMRSKESAHDYRYFPEPDLPPLTLEESYIAAIGEALPELPMARLERYGAELGLSQYDAMLLTSERPIADYFDAARAVGGDAKLTANWIASELLARLNRDGKGIAESPVSAAALGELVSLIVDKTISGKIAKEVFDKMWSTGKGAKELVAAEGLTQVTDEGAIETAAREVIDKSQKQAEQYRAGKVGLFGYFVGQTLKATGGRANPEIVNQVLRRLLDGQG